MTRFLTVTKRVWGDSRGRDRLGALITTRNGRYLFIDRHEIRAVCDDLHDIADNYDTQLKGEQQ
ncbi:hypothetical protein [Flaviflexus huanghaiensis]|uniref:hypothetical protein n=1 Tax=Flaviflexus huanghaiensis TaxID=1111473 RepID=UPI0015F98A75|nr:hypothetical protein [Flaviflexus huanghaiensis]